MRTGDLKLRALSLAGFTIIALNCLGAQLPSGPRTVQAVAVVTIDPQTVRLPVAEGGDMRFIRLRRSLGLSQQRVTRIVQDNRGFLWFGTQFGLNRYDGYHFRIFK